MSIRADIPPRWNFNGKTLTMFNIALMLLTVGSLWGKVNGHMDNLLIHQTPIEKAAQIETVVAPVRMAQTEHSAIGGHDVVTSRVIHLENMEARSARRYEQIMKSLLELKVLVEQEHGK